MRTFIGAVLLLLIGVSGGAWFMNAQIVNSTYNSCDAELINMQQMETSLRVMERDLLACRTNKLVHDSDQNNCVALKSSASSSTSVSVDEFLLVDNSVSLKGVASLRLDYLDQKIEDAPEDLEWKGAIDTSISAVLSEWPGAKQTDIHCSQYICRVEIVSGRAEQAEKIIDGLNNIAEIKGERMIQFDDKNNRAVIYLGRDGNTSLASGDGF